jgi:glycosyltransferase involved in cell wall biosynthesis
MNMRKILWVNPSFLDYRIPLYKALSERNHQEFYLIYSKNRVPERCVQKIEAVLGEKAVGLEKERTISWGKKSDFSNVGVSIPWPKGLSRAIRHIHPDIIIAEGFFQFTPWALWYSITRHIPLIIAYEKTAHTERYCPRWRRLYRKIVNRFVDAYIVNGSLTKEYLQTMGVPSQRIFTGAMSADSAGLVNRLKLMTENEKEKFREEVLSEKGGLNFLFVGRLIGLKGLDHLLDAWKDYVAIYKDDHLTIVGDGPKFQEYLQRAKDLSNVHLMGKTDYEEVYKYYAIADVFVIPTLEDNWSLVVPEAMACGLPIACSIYNGCYPELVHKGENGTLFDPLLQSSILQALTYFHVADPKRMGEVSKNIEKEYSPENVSSNILNAVNWTIRKKK